MTGEHREYEKKEARFGRVKPHTNGYLIRQDCSCPPLWRTGAWQIGARYAKLDLTDKAINGGTIQDVTVGLNWFINPNLKVQWNYVYTDRDAPGAGDGGDFHGVGMRVAHDF
jgi:phosphate-selective porin OprO and OprP